MNAARAAILATLGVALVASMQPAMAARVPGDSMARGSMAQLADMAEASDPDVDLTDESRMSRTELFMSDVEMRAIAESVGDWLPRACPSSSPVPAGSTLRIDLAATSNGAEVLVSKCRGGAEGAARDQCTRSDDLSAMLQRFLSAPLRVQERLRNEGAASPRRRTVCDLAQRLLGGAEAEVERGGARALGGASLLQAASAALSRQPAGADEPAAPQAAAIEWDQGEQEPEHMEEDAPVLFDEEEVENEDRQADADADADADVVPPGDGSRLEGNITEEEVCAVCLSSFETGVKIACGHKFCQDCIVHWLERSDSCPTCRKVVVKTRTRRVGRFRNRRPEFVYSMILTSVGSGLLASIATEELMARAPLLLQEPFQQLLGDMRFRFTLRVYLWVISLTMLCQYFGEDPETGQGRTREVMARRA